MKKHSSQISVDLLHLLYIYTYIGFQYVGHHDARGTDCPVWRVASDALGHAVEKCLDDYSDVAACTEMVSEPLGV